jgi:hypothetical protein
MALPATPTLQYFPRLDPPGDRSPSRSPRRKAQFAFKELDPLLGNLSPDSTLRALRATETISNGAAQEDALTSSIADASPAEREVGIRAAFAAQKLREWKDELTKWKWPGKQHRAFGLGFVPPSDARDPATQYRGCLPVSVANQYETRIEAIRDDLDSLEFDEIKDHVLEAHRPTASPSKSSSIGGIRSSYGRMRDFTALITATVIQALPDLAKLHRLLETWHIRLRVLRELPRFLEVMQGAQTELQLALQDIRDSHIMHTLTEPLLDDRKLALGGQVSDMGRRVDRLLDMLEGHDDTLPQAWIDRLEKIELDYATWAVEAQQVVLRNQIAPAVNNGPAPQTVAPSVAYTDQWKQTTNLPVGSRSNLPLAPSTTNSATQDPIAQKQKSEPQTQPRQKPTLSLDLSKSKSHRREVSKVSVADSMYSTFSDISNAEIMDARTASVLPSPKVNVVENPFRASRDELTWFGSAPAAKEEMSTRPPMLQRASTASIEIYPNEKLKEVILRRSASFDMLSASSPDGTPSKALRRLNGKESPVPKIAGSGSGPPPLAIDTTPVSIPPVLASSARPPSRRESQPELPRRSSKRNVDGVSPITPVAADTITNAKHKDISADETKQSRRHRKSESLDEKIQDILTTLPTRIRLAKDADSASSSATTTRSSTPTPALTLSPAKADPSSRKGSLADPEIKLYHLTRTGQSREAPPIKLFVRTVGDGDRVMVRVGGGWADLGEYLKEYSLHHGSRTAVDGRLEVANFPGIGTTAHTQTASQARKKSKLPPGAQSPLESTDLVNPKTRSSIQRPGSPERIALRDATPPPVPPIPSGYSINSPATTSAVRTDAGNVMNVVRTEAGQPGSPAETRYSITHGSSGITTTTVVTPPVVSTSYTPLGGAGPKMAPRRVATVGAQSNNDAWVQGMVGKARAVSGSSPSSTTQTSNGTSTTVTTTTTVTSTPPASNRRASSYFRPTPEANPHPSPVTISTSPSTGSVASEGKLSRRSSYGMGSRRSSRMSLGDIGGIKRVFLRKKSDNGSK